MVITVNVEDLKIRKEPSAFAESIRTAKKFENFLGSGNIEESDGYIWYELKDGGWIADNNNEWLSVYQRN